MQQLVVPAVLESLGLIRDYAADVAAEVGLDETDAYKLALAMDEIATNVVMYGYQGSDGVGDILIRAESADGRLRVIMQDTGQTFDPRSRDLPREAELAKSLDDRPIGGLGIFLALNGVDEFDYQREGNVNKNIFVMNL
jgi:anti-sigma regulatory factor (Ser/Thr protein kinase)